MSGAEELLMQSVRLVHGRDTCDDAGRPLAVYMCQYHEGFADGIEAAQEDSDDL